MDSVLTLIFAAAVFQFLPISKRDYLTALENIEAKLPQSKIDELIDYTPGNERDLDPQFWMDVNGTSGVFGLVHEAGLYSRIVQIQRKAGRISNKRAAIVFSWLVKQTYWACIESVFGSRNHNAARKSVAYYCQIVIRTNTLCHAVGNEMCPISLPYLL